MGVYFRGGLFPWGFISYLKQSGGFYPWGFISATVYQFRTLADSHTKIPVMQYP